MHSFYIGLMSGTSKDAIDGVMIDLATQPYQLVASHTLPIDATTREQLQALCHAQKATIANYARLDVMMGDAFAECALKLLEKSKLQPQDVIAIGSHGQTVFHDPNSHYPTSVQIGDPNLITQRTGITTVSDFRRRDIAVGGQGAPLAPAFHQDYFSSPDEDRVVVNLGGMANITVLPANTDQKVSGFDTGPGNVLLDEWIFKHLNKSYDDEGTWARSGKLHQALLETLLADPYFQMPAPKSTGNEYFNLSWLAKKLAAFTAITFEDVQHTLTVLTAESITQAIKQYTNNTNTVILCGGGAYNSFLSECLQEAMPSNKILSSEHFGLAPEWIEAAAFAWLAKQTLEGKPGNLPAVTGASECVLLGSVCAS